MGFDLGASGASDAAAFRWRIGKGVIRGKEEKSMLAASWKRWLLPVTLVTFALAGPADLWAQADIESSIGTMARDLAGVMKAKGVKKLAVVDFSDIRGYPSALDGFLAEELITQLMIVAPGDFNIVERRQLSRILEEQRLTSSALFDQEAIANIGKILGLDAIVTGTIADLGGEIKVNARSIAIETAQVFAAAAMKVKKEGAVAELLRQSAGPERGLAASAAPASRQVQASDVFFENKLLRVTVASVGVNPQRKEATIALQVENLSPDDLKLSLIERMQRCSATLTDERGNHSQLETWKAGGVPCTLAGSVERSRRGQSARWNDGPPDAEWPVLASRSRTAIVLPFETTYDNGRWPAFGELLSLGLELYVSRGGEIESVSMGLTNIQAPPSSSP